MLVKVLIFTVYFIGAWVFMYHLSSETYTDIFKLVGAILAITLWPLALILLCIKRMIGGIHRGR